MCSTHSITDTRAAEIIGTEDCHDIHVLNKFMEIFGHDCIVHMYIHNTTFLFHVIS